MGKLDGKTAMITGGASGIGLGALELFIEEGARVLSADIQDGQADMLKARFKDRFAYAHCDVTKNADIKAALDATAAAFGGVDILFSNAGAVGAPQSVAEMDLDGWDRTHALLLRSVVAGAHYAVPHMRKRGGGAIVNTASICALEAGYGPVAYSTMKGAVLHFTKLAAADLAREKIRVNAICPGFIATSIFGSAIGLPREGAVQMAAMLAEKGANVQPVGRIGAPRDIAEAALYFASDASGFTTGAHLVVDGGITVGPRNSWDPDAANPIAEALGFTEGSLVEGGR
jgi:NAD(P)-dependent dehydrogenase (short-subunit alcohol dehydrogenase family)